MEFQTSFEDDFVFRRLSLCRQDVIINVFLGVCVCFTSTFWNIIFKNICNRCCMFVCRTTNILSWSLAFRKKHITHQHYSEHQLRIFKLSMTNERKTTEYWIDKVVRHWFSRCNCIELRFSWKFTNPRKHFTSVEWAEANEKKKRIQVIRQTKPKLFRN